ncbi:MAG: hypothetical protein OXU54_01165 [Gammaproteobacteria bacterium]|nr:hypothetical protein [Gammaproteobacteria bacterium]
MAVTFTDKEIQALIKESKILSANGQLAHIRFQAKRGHDEGQVELTGDAGNESRVILRRNQNKALDFSVILAVRLPRSNQLFRLRRYNGKSHQHTNHIEDETFYGFRIHTATERYQERGEKEDAYAETSERYSDFHGALRCLIDDANFSVPSMAQQGLFSAEM